MMNGDDTFEFKQKISNGFADSILASSPTKNGTMNANSLSDGCDSGKGDQDHLMHEVNTKENSGFSESGSPSPSPDSDSCSPCPNGEDQDQADQYHKENNHHVNVDPVWPNGPAAVQQFTNQGGRKDGDSGFISPEGATNVAGVMEGQSLMDGATFHSDLQRQSSDGLMEFETNRTPSLDVEIDSKPLDLSLDSDVDGLASSVQDRDEDINEDFEIIGDLKETNEEDEIDHFAYERKPLVDNIIDSNNFGYDDFQTKTNTDLMQVAGMNDCKVNDDDGLGLEQDEILEDELIKTKLELKNSTDTEKEKEVNEDDYEYQLKQDDGCQAYDPMTTSMIQPRDPMTSSMINFDTQSINHDSHEHGEIESSKLHDENIIPNKEEKDDNSASSSSEDEEDHTEKKDKEKEHSSSSSSSEDEEEKVDKAEKKDNEKEHSSSSSSSEDEADKEDDNDKQSLIGIKQSESLQISNFQESSNVSSINGEELVAEKINDDDSDAHSSSSEEAYEKDDEDKDMESEKDKIPYSTISKEDEDRSSEDEDEKDLSDEKYNINVNVENPIFISSNLSAAAEEFQPARESKMMPDNEITDEAMSDKDYNTQSFSHYQCFDKIEECEDPEILPENSSSVLGDVCSIPDMHNDEVKMNDEQDVFAADKSADNVHSEDEREDSPLPDLESRNRSRKSSSSSVSSNEDNEDDGFCNEKRTNESDLVQFKSEDTDHVNQNSNDVKNLELNVENEVDVSEEKFESKEFENASQKAYLSNKQEETGICYEPEIDTVTQNDVAMEMTSSRNDNDESEDIIMKESMVTNISEGKSADFGFELNENIEHETKAESPTIQTLSFENKENETDNLGAFYEQTSSKIESNEYCYQKNEDTSLDLASLDSQVPAGQLSCIEIAENAAVSLVDENLMENNMSNIKETEFLVETSTNLAGSQEPSGIFSQNDEHMAQKVSEFGVNEEYENSDDLEEINNCMEDNATKDNFVENAKPVETVPTASDIDLSVNDPKEIYENTSFELNSVEKDSVFDQNPDIKMEEILSNVDEKQTGSQILDSESDSVNKTFNTDMELSTEQLVGNSNFNNQEKSAEIIKDDTQNIDALEKITTKLEEEKVEKVEVNELATQRENFAEHGCESNLQTGIQESEFMENIQQEVKSETITENGLDAKSQNEVKETDFTEEVEKPNTETNFLRETEDLNKVTENETNLLKESEDLNKEAENDANVEKTIVLESVSIEQTAVTELASENEKDFKNGSEMDLQTGIQDSEPAIEIETTKETNIETHLTSQELNSNTSQHNIETAEAFNSETTEAKTEPSILPIISAVPLEQGKKTEDVSESKTKADPEKKTASKPAPKTTNATKTPGSAPKSSKPSAPTSSLKKTEATKPAAAKPSPRPTASTPKTTVTKAGTAGGQASAPRRSVPPAKPSTTAPKNTARSAPSANASKPGTTTKPQTNGVSRPTSATTRTTARPASARPATTTSATAKTPISRPQTAKPSSAPAKPASSSRPATAGTTKTPTAARTPLSTRTTPLTKPSPLPSTLRPRPTSTSRLRAASATRKSQNTTPNGTSKTPTTGTKPTTARTPLSRPSSRTTAPSAATTKTPSKPTTTPARPTPSKPTPSRPTPSRTTPASKRPTPTTKTGTKAPVSKGSNKPVAIKKPNTENAENEINDLGKSEVSVEENVLIQHEENQVNGLQNGVHQITNGVNGVHSEDEGQSLEINGCNSALDCTEPVQ
eukprot:GFUD01066353.1.p1 GENE.GFUD01066353.1~~GFUD01066353.1.p1  ORF type:complete len:1730 (+),score=578.63 GFUD01066353.1:325-5514(+)